MSRLQYIAARSGGLQPVDKIKALIEGSNNMKTTIVQTFVSLCSLLSLCSTAPITNTSGSSVDAANRCCTLLRLSNANETFLATDAGYQLSIDSYWANTSKILPNCVVKPSNTYSVSTVVSTLANNTCSFAIRSGGHNPFPDNNISPGVTIDLGSINQVTLGPAQNGNGTVAKIGPGARWGQVYDTLSPLNVGVPGGRASNVGVGGLTLGGGNSFFAARYGFVCDNVENFEVVLANGTIVNANNQTGTNEHADLWLALRGGSNNFGVVTRIDLTTFPLEGGKIWGGSVFYPSTTIDQQINSLVKFTDEIESDPYASLITFWAYSSATNVTVVQNCYEYTNPAVNISDAPIFKDLLSIQPELPLPPPAKSNTVRFDNLSSITQELNAPPNVRDLFATITFANDADLVNQTYKYSQALLEPLKNKAGLSWITMFQPVPKVFATQGSKSGGNVMGLDSATDNQILFLFFVGWANEADDEPIQKAASDLIGQVKSYAGSKLGDWIYLNYADSFQTEDVLKGYGQKNMDIISKVSKAYDPSQVFQNLVPGGFKISKVMSA